uniref:Transmembrane protein n=1 Tax=Anisakis simplex TaxID=6269 RepID=A0A0M3JGM0_ANISI
LPWTCSRGMHCADWNMRRAGRFVGIADEPISVLLFCVVVFALFTHRYSMRRDGSWWRCYTRILQQPDDGMHHLANEFYSIDAKL